MFSIIFFSQSHFSDLHICRSVKCCKKQHFDVNISKKIKLKRVYGIRQINYYDIFIMHPKKKHSDTETSETDTESESFNTSSDDEIDTDDFKNIIFKEINNEYGYGKYGLFEVVMMHSNFYINATKMCKDYNEKHELDSDFKKKEFFSWKRLESAKNIIKFVANKLSIPKEEMLITNIKGTKKVTYGTYIHPDLALVVAQWISHDFYWNVNEIIKKHFSQEALEKKNKIIDKQKNEINGLENKVDDLNNKMDKVLNNNEKLLKQNKILLKKADNTEQRVIELLAESQKLSNWLYSSNDKKVVATGKKGDNNVLLIVKNNSDAADDYKYSVFRIQQKNMNSSLGNHLEIFPDMQIILLVDESPNAVNLWMRIKQALKNNFKNSKNCSFDLKKNYTQKQFIKDIKKIHNERFDNSDSDDDDDD
jgi:hypothetical protein